MPLGACGAGLSIPSHPTEFRLPYEAPFDWPAMLAFFRIRAIDGVEAVGEQTYTRSVIVAGQPGLLTVADDPDRQALVATLVASEREPGPAVVARLRRMFDLDDDARAALALLASDPRLGPRVAAHPGLRIPGHWDPFETAVRAVLGQQVTLAAARRLAVRLTERASPRFACVATDRPCRCFASPEQVLAADLSAMGMPGSRVRTLQALAEARLSDPALFRRSGIEATVARLRRIKGVGDWTAHYIALRACREPDAFPASDVGLLRSAARGGHRPTPAALLATAEAWRPFRSYAAHLLWAGDAATAPNGASSADPGTSAKRLSA